MAQFLHRRVLRRVPESAERRFIWKTNQRSTRAKRPVAFHDLLGLHHIKHFAPVFGDRCARVRHVGHELFHVMDDDLSDQIRCHSFYVSSQEELVLCGWSPKGPDHSIAAANKRRSSEEGCSAAFPPATSELSPSSGEWPSECSLGRICHAPRLELRLRRDCSAYLRSRSLQPLRLCYSADLNATRLKHGAEGIPIDPGQVHIQRYKDQSKGKSAGIKECVDTENVHKYRREYSNRERHESIYQKERASGRFYDPNKREEISCLLKRAHKSGKSRRHMRHRRKPEDFVQARQKHDNAQKNSRNRAKNRFHNSPRFDYVCENHAAVKLTRTQTACSFLAFVIPVSFPASLGDLTSALKKFQR